MDVIVNQGQIRKAVDVILPMIQDAFIMHQLGVVKDRAWDSEMKLKAVRSEEESS